MTNKRFRVGVSVEHIRQWGREDGAAGWTTIGTFEDTDGVFGRELKLGPAACNAWEGNGRLHFFTCSDFLYGKLSGMTLIIR